MNVWVYLGCLRELEHGDEIPEYRGWNGHDAVLMALADAALELRGRVEVLEPAVAE